MRLQRLRLCSVRLCGVRLDVGDDLFRFEQRPERLGYVAELGVPAG